MGIVNTIVLTLLAAIAPIPIMAATLIVIPIMLATLDLLVASLSKPYTSVRKIWFVDRLTLSFPSNKLFVYK